MIDRLSNRPRALSAIASRLQKTPVSTHGPARQAAGSRPFHAAPGEVEVFLEFQNGRRGTGYQRAAVLGAARRLGEAAVEARKQGHRLAVTFTPHSAGSDGGQGIGVAVVDAGRAGRLIATELNALSGEWNFSLSDIVVREGSAVLDARSGVGVSAEFVHVARVEPKRSPGSGRDNRFYNDLQVWVNRRLQAEPSWDGGEVELGAVLRAVEVRDATLSYAAKNINELAGDVTHIFLTQGAEARASLKGGSSVDDRSGGSDVEDDLFGGLSDDGSDYVDRGESPELALPGRGNVSSGPLTRSGASQGAVALDAPSAMDLGELGVSRQTEPIDPDRILAALPSERAIQSLGARSARPWRDPARRRRVPWARGDGLAPLTAEQLDLLYEVLVEPYNSNASIGGVWDWIDAALDIEVSPEEMHRIHRDYHSSQADLPRNEKPTPKSKSKSKPNHWTIDEYLAALEKLGPPPTGGKRPRPNKKVTVDINGKQVPIGRWLEHIEFRSIAGVRDLREPMERAGYGHLLPRAASGGRKGNARHFWTDTQLVGALDALGPPPSDGARLLPTQRTSVVVGGEKIAIGRWLYHLNKRRGPVARPVREALERAGFGFLAPWEVSSSSSSSWSSSPSPVLKRPRKRMRWSEHDYATALKKLAVPSFEGKRPLPPQMVKVPNRDGGVPIGLLLRDLLREMEQKGGRKVGPVLRSALEDANFGFLIAPAEASEPEKRAVTRWTAEQYAAALDVLGPPPPPSPPAGRRRLPNGSTRVPQEAGVPIGAFLHSLDRQRRTTGARKVNQLLAAALERAGFDYLLAAEPVIDASSTRGTDGPDVSQVEAGTTRAGASTSYGQRSSSPLPGVVGTGGWQGSGGFTWSGMTPAQMADVAQSGLVPLEVPRDGDCLMNALVLSAGLVDDTGTPRSALAVRRELAAALRMDLNLLPAERQLWTEQFEVYAHSSLVEQQDGIVDEEPYQGMSESQRDQIINLMETPGLYDNVAGDIAPVVGALHYNLDIRIHNYDGGSYRLGSFSGQAARSIDLIRLDRAHNGVDHWMATGPVVLSGRESTVDALLISRGYSAMSGTEIEDVWIDLFGMVEPAGSDFGELAALLIVARRKIDPTLLMLGEGRATVAEIIQFLPGSSIVDFALGLTDLSSESTAAVSDIFQSRGSGVS